jgi:hypothetical protein
MDTNLKELNSIPSIDLRPLVATTTTPSSTPATAITTTALTSLPPPSSNSLKDSVMKAHLLSSEITEGWMKNPWDHSTSYALYRERKDQMKFSLPSGTSSGSSINLYAPSRHRLYVRYCKQCIGVMTFVTEWNSDIEKLIQKRVESKTNEELRQVIRNLNDSLLDKAEECEKVKDELDMIRAGGKYLTVINETEKSRYQITDLEAKAKRFRSFPLPSLPLSDSLTLLDSLLLSLSLSLSLCLPLTLSLMLSLTDDSGRTLTNGRNQL